jgi:hypothetical protein
VGADSVAETFKTKIGSDAFEHVGTVCDYEREVTPNELVARPDGKGLWVSNEHKVKVGFENIPLDIVGTQCD